MILQSSPWQLNHLQAASLGLMNQVVYRGGKMTNVHTYKYCLINTAECTCSHCYWCDDGERHGVCVCVRLEERKNELNVNKYSRNDYNY